MMTEQGRVLSRAQWKETRAWREGGGEGAVFRRRTAVCQAEGQERSVANQLLIGSEHSNRARPQLPARGCCEPAATLAVLQLHPQTHQLFSLPAAEVAAHPPEKSRGSGNTAPPVSLSREGSRERSSLLSCYLPARAGGGGERPCLASALKDTGRDHSFLGTWHLLELGGCSDRGSLGYIGSIRYAAQLEPRSHCGICGASSGTSTRAQEVPRQLQPGCSLLPPPGLPPSKEAFFIPPPPCCPVGSCGGDSCQGWLWRCDQETKQCHPPAPEPLCIFLLL